MKIAFITPFPPYRGGISKHSENLYFQLKKNNSIKVFNFKKQYPDFLFPGKTQYLENYNSNLYDSDRTINSINPLTWQSTAKKIINGGYDKVLIRFWHPFFAPAYISICKKIRNSNKNIKIYAICDNILPHEPFIFQNRLIKKFIDSIDMSIVMSDQVENDFKAISNKRYEKLFLPILNDLKPIIPQTDARELLNIENEKLTFLFFGLIRKYKGLDIFLNAVNKLEKNISDKINILIVGECYENYEKYKKICQNSNISIKWFNEYIPDDKINIYFSASDYVVLPYRSASQSGIIPMAYHYNLPVIISNLDSLKKNVINNKTGLIFENENYNQLSKIISDITMNKISNDYNYIKEYKNNFTTKIFVEKLISLMK